MSGVVLRCPNCGTTQGTPGECEACHEAAVRYFCTNHTPGRWLDGTVCADCAALAAREARRPTPRTPPRPTPPPATERPRTPPRAPAGTPRREASTREPPVRDVPARDIPVRRAPAAERARRAGPAWPLPGAAGPAPAPVDVAESLRRAGEAAGVARTAARTAAGCLMRLVGIVVLLIILAFIAIVLFGGPLQQWLVDFGQQVGVVEGVPEQTRRGVEAYWSGDLPRAERELTEAAQAYPRSALALLYLAKMRMDSGDVERAGAYLRAAVEREPDNAVAHRELAGSYLVRASRVREAAGDTAARADLLNAARHYQRSLEIDPTDHRALGYHACALAALGEAARAAELLARAGSGPWESCAR